MHHCPVLAVTSSLVALSFQQTPNLQETPDMLVAIHSRQHLVVSLSLPVNGHSSALYRKSSRYQTIKINNINSLSADVDKSRHKGPGAEVD